MISNKLRSATLVLASLLATIAGFARCHGQDPFAPGGGDAFGQGNPFDGGGAAGGAPFGGPAAGRAKADNVDEPTDPLIGELRRYSKGTIEQLAIAIRSTIQIADWKEAATFLDILGTQQPSDAEYANIASIIQPHYLLRLQQQDSLNDEQRGVIQKILDGTKKHAEDRTRIKGEIAKLDDANGSVRQDALRNIRIGGTSAIAELVVAYVSDSPPASRSSLLDAIHRFGADGFRAVQQFALGGDDTQKEHALRGLAALNLQAAIPDLVSVYHAKEASETQRNVAADGLRLVLRGMPSVGEAQQYLAAAVKSSADHATRLRHTDNTQRIWQLSDDKQSVQWSDVPAKVAASREAANAAFRYQRLESVTIVGTVDAMVSELGYRFISDSKFGSKQDYQATLGAETTSATTATLLEKTLSSALVNQNEHAAIAAIRLLRHCAEHDTVASHGASRRLLVQVASHGSPRLRYEAASALGDIDFDTGYSGSSDALHRWIEMSGLQRRPTALIVEARSYRVKDQSEWLESLGYAVELSTSVRATIERLDRGGDIQLLLISSQPTDRHIVETVDIVRRHSLGRSVPILIYCQPEKTIWDEDLREPVRSASGFLISDIASSDGTTEKDDQQDPYAKTHYPISIIALDNETNVESKAIRASHDVTRERQRIEQALGRRWPAPLGVVEKIISPTGLTEMIRELTNQMPMQPMSPAERLTYSRRGIAILENIATSDNRQILYDLLSHESEVVQAVGQGGFSRSGLTLLSGLGSRQSQVFLANLAATGSLPQTTRQNAADAFTRSVQRFGTRLDRRDVVLQYDRFNAATDKASQTVLSTILDAMEKRVQATSR